LTARDALSIDGLGRKIFEIEAPRCRELEHGIHDHRGTIALR
jgi:hypothetical protein